MKLKLSKLALLVFFTSLSLCNYSCTLLSPDSNNTKATLEENLIGNVWQAKKIYTKDGTHNPDEEVAENKISRIESHKLKGEIQFLKNHKVLVKNAKDEFYLKHWNEMKWELDSNFIYFTYSYGGFGMNIKTATPGSMVWYIENNGIESGALSVNIIEFKSK